MRQKEITANTVPESSEFNKKTVYFSTSGKTAYFSRDKIRKPPPVYVPAVEFGENWVRNDCLVKNIKTGKSTTFDKFRKKVKKEIESNRQSLGRAATDLLLYLHKSHTKNVSNSDIFPFTSTIANKMGKCRRQVSYSMSRLVKAGEIIIVGTRKSGIPIRRISRMSPWYSLPTSLRDMPEKDKTYKINGKGVGDPARPGLGFVIPDNFVSH